MYQWYYKVAIRKDNNEVIDRKWQKVAKDGFKCLKIALKKKFKKKFNMGSKCVKIPIIALMDRNYQKLIEMLRIARYSQTDFNGSK